MGNRLITPSSLNAGLDRDLFIKSVIEFMEMAIPSDEVVTLLFGLESSYSHLQRVPYFQKDLAIFRDLKFFYSREEYKSWSPPTWQHHDEISRKVISLVSAMSQAERLISFLVTVSVDLLRFNYSKETFDLIKKLIEILHVQLEVICICCSTAGEIEQNPSNFPSASIWFNRLDLCMKGFDLLQQQQNITGVFPNIHPQSLCYFRGNDLELVLLVLLLQDFININKNTFTQSMLQYLKRIHQFYNEIIIPCPKEFPLIIQSRILLLSVVSGKEETDYSIEFSRLFELLSKFDSSWQPTLLYSTFENMFNCSICKLTSTQCIFPENIIIPENEKRMNYISALKESIKKSHPLSTCDGHLLLKQVDLQEINLAFKQEHSEVIFKLITDWEHDDTCAELIKILVNEIIRLNRPKVIFEYSWSLNLLNKFQHALESDHEKDTTVNAANILLQFYIKYGLFSEACKLANTMSLESTGSAALIYSDLALLNSSMSEDSTSIIKLNHFILQNQQFNGMTPTQICIKLLEIEQVKKAIDLSLITDQVTPIITEYLAHSFIASTSCSSVNKKSWIHEISRNHQYILGNEQEEDEICILRFIYNQNKSIDCLMIFVESCLKGNMRGVSIPSWILDCILYSGNQEAINRLCQSLASYGQVELLLTSLRKIQPIRTLHPETISIIQQVCRKA